MVKRSILVEVDLPRGRERGILGLMIRLCDFLDQEKIDDVLIDYGLGLVTPQTVIRELPTHVIHGEREQTVICPKCRHDFIVVTPVEIKDPKVLRDARDGILERSDRR